MQAEKVIAWGNVVASGGIHQDNEAGATLTVFLGVQSAGRAVEVRSDTGTVWYGTVDADGTALLTQSGLLPK